MISLMKQCIGIATFLCCQNQTPLRLMVEQFKRTECMFGFVTTVVVRTSTRSKYCSSIYVVEEKRVCAPLTVVGGGDFPF